MKRSLILGGTPCIAISVVILIIRNARNGARMQGIILENDILPKSLREIVGSFLLPKREKFMFPYGRDSSNGRAPLYCGGVDSISTLFFHFYFWRLNDYGGHYADPVEFYALHHLASHQ